MAHRKTLTEDQVRILRWIADGAPDGVMGGTHHRISAAALRSRKLLKITGHGGTWNATITPAGTGYLASLTKPDAPLPRQGAVSVTQQLVDDIVAAGGKLKLPRKVGWEKGVDWERRAQLAGQHGKVPDGKRLKVTTLSYEELLIELIDGPPGLNEPIVPVTVPETVGKYHPVVRAFRDDTDRHEVSRSLLPRLLKLLHGLVIEAEARGMTVKSAAPEPDRNGRSWWTGPKYGHITFTVDDCSTVIRITEEGLGSRTHWEGTVNSWHYRQEHPGRVTRDDYEAKGTGKLKFEILTYNHGQSRQAKWTDSRKGLVEHRLGEILREVQLRAIERTERKRQVELDAIEQRSRWEAAVERATVKVVEVKRAEVLDRQIHQWEHATRIRAYCDAVVAAHPDDAGAEEWVMWARAYAGTIDPLDAAPVMPTPPERISPEDLRPFMAGWDPYLPPQPRFVG